MPKMSNFKKFKIPVATMSVFGEVVRVPKYYQEFQFDFESFLADPNFYYVRVFGTPGLFDSLSKYEDVTEVP